MNRYSTIVYVSVGVEVCAEDEIDANDIAISMVENELNKTALNYEAESADSVQIN